MTDVVVDTSAALALLTGEEHGGRVAFAMEESDRRIMSAATLVELGIVLEAKLGPVGAAVLERYLQTSQTEIVALESVQARVAVEAWRNFGKGRHRAALNLGDTFVYALAATTAAPVLCVGTDFAGTDLVVVDLA